MIEGINPEGVDSVGYVYGQEDPLEKIVHSLSGDMGYEGVDSAYYRDVRCRNMEHHDVSDYVTLDIDHTSYALPVEDRADSLTIYDATSMNVLSDTDGDGYVDYISSVGYDGQWSTWRWRDVDDITEVDVKNSHSSAPEQGGERWQNRAWKCIEWGQWG